MSALNDTTLGHGGNVCAVKGWTVDAQTGEIIAGRYLGPGALSHAHIRPVGSAIVEGAKVEASPGGEYFRARHAKLKLGGQSRRGGGRRGVIRGFSRGSRRRLMDRFAKVKRGGELPRFLTLTFPADYPDSRGAHRAFDVFYRRLMRHYRNVRGFWRVEPQKRGAAHFHMLLWGLDGPIGEVLDWVAHNWYEIAGQGDYNVYLVHMGVLPGSKPCVSDVQSWRQAWAYVSKYVAKDCADDGGTAWGWSGRRWGMWRADAIPWADVVTVAVSEGAYWALLRLERRYLRRRWWRGETVYCEVTNWLRAVAWANAEYG